MKKIIILLLIIISNLSFSQNHVPKIVKLSQTNVNFLKENYNWKEETFLLVNFRMPKNKCHYNNYSNLNSSLNWWKLFYMKLNLGNVANRFVSSDSIAALSLIDNDTQFSDKDSFILNQFFKEYEACYGIIIFDKNGHYVFKSGEYTQKDVENLLAKIETY